MPAGSAKGTLLLGAVVAVRRHRDHGRLSPTELAERLSPGTIALFDQQIDITRWYPIDQFCELLDLEWEIGGHHDPLYLERQGSLTADRLFDSGLYQQLEFADRAGRSTAETRQSLERQARLIVTITGSLYDFLSAKVSVDPSLLRIEYGNATQFSEALALTTVGFMNQINLRQGSKRRWTMSRPATDRVVFSMELPERLTD